MRGLFLVALVLLFSISLCSGKDFYVTPSFPGSQPCPDPCYTLNQYAQNVSLFENQPNITLKFLGGNHSLKSNLLIIGDKLILSPQISEAVFSDSVFIYSSNDFHSIELAGKDVAMEHMTFIRIDLSLGVHTDPVYPAQSLVILGCVLFGSSLQIGSMFRTNPINSLVTDSVFCGDHQQSNGIFIAQENGVIEHTLTLHNCSISQYVDSGMITLGRVSIAVTNTRITQNTQGLFLSSLNKILIDNTTISHSEQYGIFIGFSLNVTIINSDISFNQIGISLGFSGIAVSDTLIRNNAVGFTAVDLSGNGQVTFSIEMNGCFINQNNLSGISLYFQEKAIFHNCTFDFNTGTPIFAYQSTFELTGNTVFSNNKAEQGSGLSLYQSTVKFSQGSDTLFTNNTASQYGGGIYNAAVPIPLPQILVALENSFFKLLATTGKIVTSRSCFYSAVISNNTSVRFSNNSASLGGRSIFGIETSSYTTICRLDKPSIFKLDETEPTAYQLASEPTRVCFCYDNIPQCSNRNFLVLNETRYAGENFQISVTLTGFNYGRVVGTVFSNVLGDTTARLDTTQYSQFVGDYTQCSDLNYTVLSNDTGKVVILSLKVDEQLLGSSQEDDLGLSVRNTYTPLCDTLLPPCTALLTTPVYINITLEPCPLGFQINEDENICNCAENLAKFREDEMLDLTCEINNRSGYITREGTVWIGLDTSNPNNTDVYYWHRYCPRDYCSASRIAVDLKDPDTQCSMNRAGVLCGSCASGYSLELGGNRCVQCNNSFLALLIVFAILGIMLVAAIKVLDITVSGGFINGLIFYANVVWMNRPILFPLQENQTITHYIFAVPIAWINLDFGIESCFSENLDQLTKTILQFVFPTYIWLIACLIILVSRYSTKATRFFGRTSVPILGTLLLLSYGKIFRTITDIFIYADISASTGSVGKVWSLDGNVTYGVTPIHILLLVLAIFYVTGFLVPFTLTILLVPLLKAKSNLWPLRWINKLNPFFDAFYGPLKAKKESQIWVGILLLARVLILIVFATTSTFDPSVSILLMTLLSISLLMYSSMVGLLYKEWSISLSENVYIMNLAVLGGAYLYKIQEQVVFVSIGIALFQFVCIVIIRIGKRIKKFLPNSRKRQKREIHEVKELEKERIEQLSVTTTQVVELNQYDPSTLREPLLND